MRDNFTAKTKRVLAGRVAYLCCFPNCKRTTIGPRSTTGHQVTLMGQAAHIHAASPGGPRYLAEMSKEDRVAIINGIWMCTHHAKLIDADQYPYTADTLKQWKDVMEAETYRRLKDLEIDEVPTPTTLVCLDLNLMFEAIWKSAEDNHWTFIVKRFVFGNEQILREYGNPAVPPMLNYIIIESQADGRLIRDKFQWRLNRDQEYEVTVQVLPKTERRDPGLFKEEISHDPAGDIMLPGKDGKLIAGKDVAIQIIQRNLSMPLGGWKGNRLLGSLFSTYYQQYQHNKALLNRIIKIELTRLITIPAYQTDTPANKPELDFVSKIETVEVRDALNGKVPVFLELEWGDHSTWANIIHVQLYDKSLSSYHVPEYVERLFAEKPLSRLRQLTANINREEIEEKVSNSVIFGLFDDILPQIKERAEVILGPEVYPLFITHQVSRTFNNNTFEYNTSVDIELMARTGSIQQIGLTLKLEGFRKGETNSFSLYKDLFFYFQDFHYEIGNNRESTWIRRLYHKPLSADDVQNIADIWVDQIVIAINERIEWFCK